MDELLYADEYENTASVVLDEITKAINAIDIEQTERFIKEICGAEKVFLIGVGRVMLSLQAIAKRLSHLGIDVHCVGDITEPAITPNDILIVASGSGESIVPVVIAKKAKELGCKRIIHIGSNPNGSMSQYSDYMVRIPVQTRLYLSNEIKSKQIMTSLFEQSLLVYGDIVSMIIAKKRGIGNYWRYHANLE